jgi:hypothetical protein
MDKKLMSETEAINEPSTNENQPPTVVAKETAYKSAGEASELIRSDAGDITATTVTLDRSGAEQITADRVQLERSGAKSMNAKSVQMDRSGVLSLKSDHTVLHDSAAVTVSASEARIVKSKILMFLSAKTTVEGELKPLIYIGKGGDNVKPVIDGKSAGLLGAAFGLIILFGGRLARLISGGS